MRAGLADSGCGHFEGVVGARAGGEHAGLAGGDATLTVVREGGAGGAVGDAVGTGTVGGVDHLVGGTLAGPIGAEDSVGSVLAGGAGGGIGAGLALGGTGETDGEDFILIEAVCAGGNAVRLSGAADAEEFASVA